MSTANATMESLFKFGGTPCIATSTATWKVEIDSNTGQTVNIKICCKSYSCSDPAQEQYQSIVKRSITILIFSIINIRV